MKTIDKFLAASSVAAALLCFIAAGKYLAQAIKNVWVTNYLMAFLDVVLAIWLFYWGYRNSKNAIYLIKEWIHER